MSARAVKKVAKRVVKKAANKTSSAMAVVAARLHIAPRVVKHARATLKGLPRRTKRLVKSNPVPVLLGASAIGFALAKLQRLV